MSNDMDPLAASAPVHVWFQSICLQLHSSSASSAIQGDPLLGHWPCLRPKLVVTAATPSHWVAPFADLKFVIAKEVIQPACGMNLITDMSLTSQSHFHVRVRAVSHKWGLKCYFGPKHVPRVTTRNQKLDWWLVWVSARELQKRSKECVCVCVCARLVRWPHWEDWTALQ